MGNRKIIFVASALVIITCVCGCGNTAKYKELSAPAIAELDNGKYELEKVKKGDIYKGVTVDGLMVPVKEYSVSFNTSGAYIKNIVVKDGDLVKKGQVLAELDTDSLNSKIGLQEIRLNKMKLILENLTNSKAKESAIKSIQLDIEAGELLLERFKTELAESKLISSVSGRIRNCGRVKAGEMVRMNQPIMTIDDIGQMQVECRGEQVNKLRVGMKTKVNYKNGEFKGEVVSLDKEEAEGKLTKTARVNLASLPKDSSLGETAKVTVELGMKQNVLVISKKCVRTTGSYAIVEVWENNSKVERFIEIGAENDSQVEVINGLSEGEEIVKFKQ